MKAEEITAAGVEALRSGRFDVVRINFANPDMVGHTGDLAATVRACAKCDDCLRRLLEVVDELEGRWLVTSDHGNADDMCQRAKKTKVRSSLARSLTCSRPRLLTHSLTR